MSAQNTSIFDGRQLLIKNVSPIKSLTVLSHVLSMTKGFVGSPQDNEEHDVCTDKKPHLKINVGSIGSLKLKEEKSSWGEGLKQHCSSYMNLSEQ